MVFVKTSNATQKCLKCCFLEYKVGELELVFGGSFSPTTTGCILQVAHVQVVMREEVFLYHDCYVLRCYFTHLGSN
jgi:hypothetical protein